MQSMSVSLERACKRSAEDCPIVIFVSPNTVAKFRRRFPSEGGDTRKPLNNLKIIDTENNAEIPEQSLYLYVIPDETIGNAPQPLCQGLKSVRSLDEADPCLGFVASPMAKDDASGNEMSSDERMVLESRLDHQQQENRRQQKRYDKLRAYLRERRQYFALLAACMFNIHPLIRGLFVASNSAAFSSVSERRYAGRTSLC
ncbi:hypothetical protein CYMTET_11632 [Cymbomonas tetramitiformis]|uniref:Uncharacterized protein n=1 Tax=Cymbomonas tetramitiformis TaxID=36881 RepID=A0AAE0GMB8_9CHLO|nr:hypothetical protein CYMTET_11632 [Cymbomonas tetramitiformis]